MDPMRTLSLALVVVAGCGSSFTSADVTTDAATESASDDAETHDGPADSGAADSSADVAQDSPQVVESGIVDAGAGDVDGPPCTPLKFPLPPPAQCASNQGPFIDAPGSYWVMQLGSYVCSSQALPASAACEMCKETYDCACLRPLVGDGGAMCINGTTGPFFTE